MSTGLKLVEELARDTARLGVETGLPYIAASADIGSPEAIVGVDGRPVAETIFRWLDPDLQYWRDRGFALRSPFVYATRFSAEPFYYRHGRFGTWRPAAWVDTFGRVEAADAFGIGAAIIAPAYLPRGVIGAIVWASPDPEVPVETIFAARASEFHAAALKLAGACQDLRRPAPAEAARLTRREIQCLKWAAAGKTDMEIGTIVRISTPTVRFHITNAAGKLGVGGRSQAVLRAANLGYIGAAAAG
ncbi:LuxR C-terminal-related transcriptional regulator [Caulobacter sp. 73W]|uniref:LuxR C-terminal-related transcriptional regulator n=1 Tax=Caulobacter sp. 73W TaxID=3161137 RepID=A0AB39KUZ7_9CAUL